MRDDNCGNAPTFLRGTQKWYVDLTLSTEWVARRMKKWRVLEHENLSDHQDIVWVLGTTGECTRERTEKQDWGWRMAEEKKERLAEGYVCQTKTVLEETCDRVLKRMYW